MLEGGRRELSASEQILQVIWLISGSENAFMAQLCHNREPGWSGLWWVWWFCGQGRRLKQKARAGAAVGKAL